MQRRGSDIQGNQITVIHVLPHVFTMFITFTDDSPSQVGVTDMRGKAATASHSPDDMAVTGVPHKGARTLPCSGMKVLIRSQTGTHYRYGLSLLLF